MTLRFGTSLGLVGLAVGCSGATPLPESAAPHDAAPQPTKQAAAPPHATASATPATAPASPPSLAPSFPTIAHQYQRIASGSGSLILYAGVPRWFDGERSIDLRSGKVEFNVGFSNSVFLLGDGLWFGEQFSAMSACPMPSAFAKFENGAWKARFEGNVHALLADAWVPGSSIAAFTPLRLGPPWGYELVVLEKNRTPPRAARRLREQKPECHTRLDSAESLLAFETGEIFVLGRECDRVPKEVEPTEPTGECECSGYDCPPECPAPPEEPLWIPPLLIESFAKGKHDFLPYPFDEARGLHGNAPTSIWTTGMTEGEKWAFAHFDGKTWTVLPERYAEVSSFQLPPAELGLEARRLFLTEGNLVEVRGSSRQHHELPAGCSPIDFELDGEHLWVECESAGETTVFTTRSDIPPYSPPPETPDAEPAEPTTFVSKKLPRLDPSAPSQHSCGESRGGWDDYGMMDEPPRKSGSAGSKPSVTRPTAPRPPSGGSKKGWNVNMGY